MKALKIFLLFLFIATTASEAYAFPRLFRRRARNNYSYTYTNNYNSGVSGWGNSPQAAAENKAAYAAARGIRGHVGGGFGGGNAEGVGWGATAQQALNNCCFTGQRPLLGSAVVWGNGMWYACKIFR